MIHVYLSTRYCVRLGLFSLLILATAGLAAQRYTSSPAIPFDSNNAGCANNNSGQGGLTDTISVSGLPTVLDGDQLGVTVVGIDISHSWNNDVQVSLVAPDGTRTFLFGDAGGVNDGFDISLRPNGENGVMEGEPPTVPPQGT